MINVKELRLGNLIEYHVTDSVDGTDEWVDNYVDYDDIGWISLQKNDERYRPKVLTEDLLVRMGAKPSPSYHAYYLYGKRIHFIEGVWLHYATRVKLPFVHTLQNFIFALTGKELEIKEASE